MKTTRKIRAAFPLIVRFVVQKNTALKGNVNPAGFPAGIKLALEEHEQECDQTYYLLVAQLQLEGKLNHVVDSMREQPRSTARPRFNGGRALVVRRAADLCVRFLST
jgi:hypothetical protein